MDEAGFDLGYKQKVKNITQCIRACNGQAVPPSNEHITSITTIEIDSALVPPLIIYQGAHLQDAWTSTCDKDWLEDVFDSYTRNLARDGRDPDSFSLMIGRGGQRVLKGMFYLWHQRAWAQVATPRQIRSAWRKSGLWPLNKQVMDVDPHTPPPQHAAKGPLTPNNLRILRANNLAVKQGKLDALVVQDAPFLRQLVPDLYIWKHPLFSKPSYVAFEAKALAEAEIANTTVSDIMRQGMPELAHFLSTNFKAVFGVLRQIDAKGQDTNASLVELRKTVLEGRRSEKYDALLAGIGDAFHIIGRDLGRKGPSRG
ncbi:hypothetical protein D1P53_004400 [Cryptococcus gattii VGV]|nr:hypothetical protein D1P53_004400 [Cryptococcus gattii VGV]